MKRCSMNRYRGVIIGCGGRAFEHAYAYRACKQTELVAVADIVEERAIKLSEKYGVSHYLDAEEMVEREDPDIVSVVTKEKPRCKLALLAAKHGVKAIVAEKPMASNLSEARSMVEACDESGTVLTVSHQMRFCDEFVAARDALRSGKIGRPFFMRAMSFGHLMEQGPHMVDMLLWLNGDSDVDWVMGQVADVKEGLETVHVAPAFVVGYLAFENGVRATLECGRLFPRSVSMVPLADSMWETWLQKCVQILGLDGIIEAIVSHHCRMLNTSQQGWKILVSGGGQEGWKIATLRYYEELARVLAEGGEHRNDAHVALKGFEIIQAIYQSVLTRERVHPPISEDADPLAKLMKEVTQ